MTSHLPWLAKWSLRLLSVTGTQVFTQVLNGVVAFVLIRTLSKPEYAWFTIASSMGAVFTALNDGGIATAVTSAGGEVWQDRRRFSALMAAALGLLKRTALVTAAVVAPLLVWLLAEKEAGWGTIGLVVLLVIGPQGAATRTTTLATANRLHSRVRELQLAEVAAALVRASVTLVPAACGWVNLPVALGAVALSCLVQAALVRRQVAPLLDLPADPQETAVCRGRIRGVMRQMYPNVLFHCVQSQLGTWLLSVLGSASQLADLGALSRLAFFSNFISAPLGYLITPAFARCQDRGRLLRLFLGVLGGYLLLLGAFLGAVAWQADRVLWLFGAKYAHLHHELLLVALSVVVGFVNQLVWSLNYARGWVRRVWLNIPLTLAAQVAAVLLFDTGTVAGVAKLMITTSAVTLLLGAVVSGIEFRLWNLRHLRPNSC